MRVKGMAIRKIILILFTIFFYPALNIYSQENSPFATFEQKIQYYKDLFKVKCANEKITDNRGKGFDALYGTRNMRVILHGIAYRGGANNAYHKKNKRDNQNPLPEDGLENLCANRFSKAIYLYKKNFDRAEKQIFNEKINNSLDYIQISGNSREEQRRILQEVFDVIMRPELGPIYLHCWNGWHQSGYIASIILMQFCDLSNDDALQYWTDNTDGNHKGYDKIKKEIQNFSKFDEFYISDDIKKEICPCLKKDKN